MQLASGVGEVAKKDIAVSFEKQFELTVSKNPPAVLQSYILYYSFSLSHYSCIIVSAVFAALKYPSNVVENDISVKFEKLFELTVS